MSRRTNADPRDESSSIPRTPKPVPAEIVALVDKLRATGATKPQGPPRPEVQRETRDDRAQ